MVSSREINDTGFRVVESSLNVMAHGDAQEGK